VIDLERAKSDLLRSARLLAAVMNPVSRVRLCDEGFDASDLDPEVDLRRGDGGDQAADNAAHPDGGVGDVVRVSERVDDVVCAQRCATSWRESGQSVRRGEHRR
jgi:hypothetical protein